MKELILAILTGICTYALIILASIGLEALGTWLYGWDSVGVLYTIALSLGPVPAVLAARYVYEEVLS